MQDASSRIEDQGPDRWEMTDSAVSDRRAATVSQIRPRGLNDPADEVVILDDFPPRLGLGESRLCDRDLDLVEALLAVLEAGRIGNPVKPVRIPV
ncbi:MAG: hypothetical protein JWR89_2638, partial [Tardiphaga sp.]|uniref:hypothetical protein n=1 Tax=Tardiphaga sp. TaxID=1926292 RepID=UPI002611294B